MEKQILQTEPPHKRAQYLKDTAEKVETMTYPLALDENELNNLKTEFSQDAIELDKHEQVLKAAREAFKGVAKPLKLKMGSTMQKIRTRQEEVTEEVFLIADQEAQAMGYYNALGHLVYQRPLMRSERQLRIEHNNKNGTN